MGKKTEVENLVADSLMCLMYCIGIVMKQKWLHTFIFVSPQIRETFPGDCKLQPWRTQDDTLDLSQ